MATAGELAAGGLSSSIYTKGGVMRHKPGNLRHSRGSRVLRLILSLLVVTMGLVFNSPNVFAAAPGPVSNIAAAPGPVSGIVATPGIDGATVQWTVPATTTEVTNYTIVATPTSGNAAPVTAASPSPTSLIGPLSPNTSWNFTVTPNSVNGSGPP